MSDYVQITSREMAAYIMLHIGKNGVSKTYWQYHAVFSQYQAPQYEMTKIKGDINRNIKEMCRGKNYSSQIKVTL